MAVVRSLVIFRCSIYYVISIDKQGVQCICNITINEFNYIKLEYFEK